MSTAIIGRPHTFHVLFVDEDNIPIAVTGPTAKVFSFNAAGTEIIHATSSMSPVPGDTGRYELVLIVPTTLTPGQTLYADMRGTNPATSEILLTEDSADLISAPSGGLTARFIR